MRIKRKSLFKIVEWDKAECSEVVDISKLHSIFVRKSVKINASLNIYLLYDMATEIKIWSMRYRGGKIVNYPYDKYKTMEEFETAARVIDRKLTYNIGG